MVGGNGVCILRRHEPSSSLQKKVAKVVLALVEHPPMGRKKLTTDSDAKLKGRNELIAEYIKSKMGVTRSRKQVSSHIQVIKPWVTHDPFGSNAPSLTTKASG